jgi:hypothetical protein
MNTCGPVNDSAPPAVAQRDKQTYCCQLEQLHPAESVRLIHAAVRLWPLHRSSNLGGLRHDRVPGDVAT